jgi:formate dehydrogenase iron-sulfur subunit
MPIGDGASSPNQARHDYVARGTKVGFFTDPTLCIGCKACEVACKEWNQVPGDGFRFSGESYDNSGGLGASTWRHVKFVELGGEGDDALRWLFLSDVCKHCEVAGCLEACPTGAIIRNEVGAVFVQDDVCNGCGYCVVSCPFGVIDRRPASLPGGGGAFKCTLCYDRQISGLTPACAKACPTESIRFGPLKDLEHQAEARARELAARGFPEAHVYDARAGSVGGIHALFLAPVAPERFGLPPAPDAPTSYLSSAWLAALIASAVAFTFTLLAFLMAR